MKIGIVCYPTFGGSGVVATELGIELAQRGNEVHFITYKQPVRLATLNNNIHYHEVHVPEYPLFHYQPYELALSSKLVNMVKKYHIELLHVHYAIPHAYAAYMAKQILAAEGIDVPIVTTLHGTDITLVGNHPFYKPAVTFSINNSDKVTSVSESLKKDTLRLFDIKNEIHVIPNFIKVANYDKVKPSDCQRSAMATEQERIITHVSNFRKVKRIDNVIRVFNETQKVVPSKLILVGDGPERQMATDLVKSFAIEDKVLFMGNSNEVDEILCFSDLFLLPSETESFGLAALEAMVSGVPVISSNTGGLPEVNIEGVSGFLNDVEDVNGMAKNAIKLLQSPTLLATFKQQARTASKNFDIDMIIPQYEKLYLDALNKKNS
jgi:N-acetyl-alpha-D-glucosaminyl L-malate synthase BshA